jgi:hypothetical protein
MTNSDLAAQARALADQAMQTRRAALFVAVALDEARNVAAAYMIVRNLADKTLAGRATDLRDQLTASEPGVAMETARGGR